MARQKKRTLSKKRGVYLRVLDEGPQVQILQLRPPFKSLAFSTASLCDSEIVFSRDSKVSSRRRSFPDKADIPRKGRVSSNDIERDTAAVVIKKR